jgi:hypothetical protein
MIRRQPLRFLQVPLGQLMLRVMAAGLFQMSLRLRWQTRAEQYRRMQWIDQSGSTEARGGVHLHTSQGE